MSLGEELHPLSPKPHKEQGLMKPWHLGTSFIMTVVITIILILIIVIAILLKIRKLVLIFIKITRRRMG